jgi:protein-S-isoprenylcysteine O-methyltransferase Ste14
VSRDLAAILSDLEVDQVSTSRKYLITYALLNVLWWVAMLFGFLPIEWFFTINSNRTNLIFFFTLGCDSLLVVILCFMILKRRMPRLLMFLATLLVYAGWLSSAYFGFCFSQNVWGLYAMTLAAVTFTALLKQVMGWNIIWGPFRFRPSLEDNPRKRVANVLLQTAMMYFTFLFVLPILVGLFEFQFLWRSWIPENSPMWRGLLILGMVIGAWIGIHFSLKSDGTPLPIEGSRKLVISGPYAYIRNPMAFIGILNGVLVGLAWNSMLVVTYALCGGLLWEICVRPLEEKYLSETFGEDYETYRKKVRCWIPSLVPYRSR